MKEEHMRIEGKQVTVFRIKNRRGFAAVCDGHLTEGDSETQACARMAKALRRTGRRNAKKK